MSNSSSSSATLSSSQARKLLSVLTAATRLDFVKQESLSSLRQFKPIELQVLLAVASSYVRGQPLSKKQLAAHVGIEHHLTIKKVADFLVDRGLVTVSPSPSDRRAELVLLTEQGSSIVHAILVSFAEAMQETIAVLAIEPLPLTLDRASADIPVSDPWLDRIHGPDRKWHASFVESKDNLEKANLAIQVMPTNPSSWVARAQCYLDQSDFALALTDIRKAFDLGERSLYARLIYARALRGLEQHQEALALLNDIIAAAPRVHHPYLERALLHEAMGAAERALADYQTSLTIQPGLQRPAEAIARLEGRPYPRSQRIPLEIPTGRKPAR